MSDLFSAGRVLATAAATALLAVACATPDDGGESTGTDAGVTRDAGPRGERDADMARDVAGDHGGGVDVVARDRGQDRAVVDSSAEDAADELVPFDATWVDRGSPDLPEPTIVALTIVSAQIQPYKSVEDKSPWDWDGVVPDALVDAIATLIQLTRPVDGILWATLIRTVADVAPDLLEGDVPPDPYYELSSFGTPMLDPSETIRNTLEPRWVARPTLVVAGEELLLTVRDEDLAFDDLIQEVIIAWDDLTAIRGEGDVEFQHLGRLFSLTIRVE